MKPYGFNYWQYFLIHIYDILVVLHMASTIIEGVDKVYELKNYIEMKKTYCDPRRYLGANVGNFDLPYGSVTE